MGSYDWISNSRWYRCLTPGALQLVGDLIVEALADGVFEQIDPFAIDDRPTIDVGDGEYVFDPLSQSGNPGTLHAQGEFREYPADAGQQSVPVSGDDCEL